MSVTSYRRRLVRGALTFCLSATLALLLNPRLGLADRPQGQSRGFYSSGSLVDGAPLPSSGAHHYLLFPATCHRRPGGGSTSGAGDPRGAPRVRAGHFYGHPRVVAAVQQVAQRVRARLPTAPRLPVGDLSGARGGRIPGHLSHQNGLDVDVFFLGDKELNPCVDGPSFERRVGGRWRVIADFKRAANWALAAEFAARKDVKRILIGTLIYRELRAWARRNAIPRAERRRTLRKLHPVYCRAPKGVSIDTYRRNFCPHDDHIHVRFRCPPGSPACRERR